MSLLTPSLVKLYFTCWKLLSHFLRVQVVMSEIVNQGFFETQLNGQTPAEVKDKCLLTTIENIKMSVWSWTSWRGRWQGGFLNSDEGDGEYRPGSLGRWESGSCSSAEDASDTPGNSGKWSPPRRRPMHGSVKWVEDTKTCTVQLSTGRIYTQWKRVSGNKSTLLRARTKKDKIQKLNTVITSYE